MYSVKIFFVLLSLSKALLATDEEIKELEAFGKTLDGPQMEKHLDNILETVDNPEYLEATKRLYKDFDTLDPSQIEDIN